jgi:hypothetical protein
MFFYKIMSVKFTLTICNEFFSCIINKNPNSNYLLTN